MKEFLEIPSPPRQSGICSPRRPRTLGSASTSCAPRSNKVVVATGAGVPEDVTPSAGAEHARRQPRRHALRHRRRRGDVGPLGRRPSRIGFGFDGLHDENGVKTVRPKNAAQFLEVNFEGYGWVPIIGTPPKAKQSLNTDKDAKFNPTVTPSDDVAVELYIPIELENLRRSTSVCATSSSRSASRGRLVAGVSLAAVHQKLRRLNDAANGRRAVLGADRRRVRRDPRVRRRPRCGRPLRHAARVPGAGGRGRRARRDGVAPTRALYGDLEFTAGDGDVAAGACHGRVVAATVVPCARRSRPARWLS